MRRLLPLLAALFLLQGCASLFVGLGLGHKSTKKSVFKSKVVWEELVPGISEWADSLREAGVMKDTFIVFDGVRLKSSYMGCGSGKTAVVVHGYNSTPVNVMMLARMYRDSLGYNVWMPCLRNNGGSEGKCVQMGWLDRLDVLQWCEVAHSVFADTLQVLHGVSMGAATVMMASGEQTPDYIRGFIEDCGYTSVYEIVEVVLPNKIGWKPHPMVDNGDVICQRRYGWGFKEASSVEQLRKSSKPVFFIHGDADKLVPPSMAQECYDAKQQGYKELWMAPGAGHARSYPKHPEEYTARVREFLEKYVEL